MISNQAPVHIFLSASIGLSYVFTHLSSHEFQQVNKPRCHSEHRHEKIPGLTAQHCNICGQLRDSSMFASKGRARLSKLCKDCDNQRRRSTYAPSTEIPDWDHLKIRFEFAQPKQDKVAELLWEMLVDQKIIGDASADFENETLDSLLNRRSTIDGIIERG